MKMNLMILFAVFGRTQKYKIEMIIWFIPMIVDNNNYISTVEIYHKNPKKNKKPVQSDN